MFIQAIEIDETRHYNIADSDRAKIAAIREVYAYQPDKTVHCCELTASHELHYLYTYLVLQDGESDDSGDLDSAYCYGRSLSDDVLYMHCSVVSRLQPKACGEHESIEDAIEYLRGNCPF